MQKFISRLSGKKILLLVPVIALLAAGCGSSQSADNNNQSVGQQSTPAPVSNMTNSAAKETMAPAGPMWQATLLKSDDTATGSYMIMVSGHKIYLKTSRDFSSLMGKPVNVSYTGSLASFSLNDITAQ